MKPIREVAKYYGSQRKLAKAMNTQQSQIAKWIKRGAMVNPDGELWYKQRDGVEGLALYVEEGGGE
jgi:hypothetical protein